VTDSRHTCAVTGANGFLGALAVRHFVRSGWTTFGLSRSPLSAEHARHVPFSLENPLEPGALESHSVDALVHCAYDFRPVSWRDINRVNVEGSIRLFAMARKAGVQRIVFISSISAFPGCRSLYGKAKLEIERAAHEAGAIVIRPGLIYGGEECGGMFGALRATVKKSRIVPLIGSGKYPQYLVCADDLLNMIERAAAGTLEPRGAILTAASPQEWPMRKLLAAIASHEGLQRTFLPIPWPAVWLGLKCAEVLHVNSGFRSDSVISLVNQNPAPDFSTAKEFECAFRDPDLGPIVPVLATRSQ